MPETGCTLIGIVVTDVALLVIPRWENWWTAVAV
jgi:hypothetical protein